MGRNVQKGERPNKCKFQFIGSMSEPFSKISSISDEYEYLNIQIKLPSNKLRNHILAISGIQIYLDIHSVNMWHPNIFG